MTDRRTTVATTELDARCLECPWSTTAPNGQGNAAKHHDATGHAVEVTNTRHVLYGERPTVARGQMTIADAAAAAPGFRLDVDEAPDAERRERCPGCGYENTRDAFEGWEGTGTPRDHAHGRVDAAFVVRCPRCELEHPDQRPSAYKVEA